MGLQFLVTHANWLAHILQPTGATPRLNTSEGEAETLREFIERLSSGFYSSREESIRLREVLSRIPPHNRLDEEVLAPIRDYFSDVPWVVLLIPSGDENGNVSA